MSDVHDYLAARRDCYPCTNCGGKGRINVPWTVIKKIMAAIRKQAFANKETNS
jgi:hypothetical protein